MHNLYVTVVNRYCALLIIKRLCVTCVFFFCFLFQSIFDTPFLLSTTVLDYYVFCSLSCTSVVLMFVEWLFTKDAADLLAPYVLEFVVFSALCLSSLSTRATTNIIS